LESLSRYYMETQPQILTTEIVEPRPRQRRTRARTRTFVGTRENIVEYRSIAFVYPEIKFRNSIRTTVEKYGQWNIDINDSEGSVVLHGDMEFIDKSLYKLNTVILETKKLLAAAELFLDTERSFQGYRNIAFLNTSASMTNTYAAILETTGDWMIDIEDCHKCASLYGNLIYDSRTDSAIYTFTTIINEVTKLRDVVQERYDAKMKAEAESKAKAAKKPKAPAQGKLKATPRTKA